MRQILEIQPNLHVLEVALPGLSVRSIVAIGERHAVVWDTLTGAKDMAALEPVIGTMPFHVVYSHADWDHIWGTGGFTRPPLAIVGHKECLRRFSDDVPITLSEMQLAEPGKWDGVELIPPNLVFSTSMSLDLGGITLELHHLPGHSVDGIVGWIPEWGVLLGGDALETPLPVVNNPDLLGAWLDALETWAKKSEVKRSLPAHGSIKGRDSLDSTLDYLRRLAASDDFELTSDLDDFYLQTHQNNLELTRVDDHRGD